ncbi:MAG: T9SS type A sorting domain-containing protein [bacterium]|nr:T9SS type A sorting domain-containing protein [bacterium]
MRYGFVSGQAEALFGSGSGGLNGAADLACDGEGHLLVCSQNTDAVLRYDVVTGSFLGVFVASGSGGLDIPVGLTIGNDGHLYVASYATNAVLRYDGTNGAFLGTFVASGAGGLDGPSGIVFGPDGDLYVCSRDNDRVLRYDGGTGASLGAFVAAGAGGLDAPRGLTFGPDGHLYVAEEVHDSVRRYDGTTGTFIDVFVATGAGGLDRANDVAFGPDGRLYVASFNNNQLLAYDGVTGAFAGALPSGLLDGPAWVTVGCRSAVSAVPPSRVPTAAIVVEPGTPNPFNPRTTVAFTLPAAGPARVSVVDAAGRQVATLLQQPLDAGRHQVEWDGLDDAGRAAPSGIYLIRVEGGGAAAATKVALLR